MVCFYFRFQQKTQHNQIKTKQKKSLYIWWTITLFLPCLSVSQNNNKFRKLSLINIIRMLIVHEQKEAKRNMWTKRKKEIAIFWRNNEHKQMPTAIFRHGGVIFRHGGHRRKLIRSCFFCVFCREYVYGGGLSRNNLWWCRSNNKSDGLETKIMSLIQN